MSFATYIGEGEFDMRFLPITEGDTLLHIATRLRNKNAINLLLKKGAAFRKANVEGKTAIDLAIDDEVCNHFFFRNK